MCDYQLLATSNQLPLWLLVGIWFQVYFTALTGLLFTFPSRYLFTIGLEKYLDLPVSTGRFPRAIRVPGYLRTETKKAFCFNSWGYHPLGPIFPDRQANKKLCNFSAINGISLPRNPYCIATTSLVSSAFARRYLRNAYLFLFLLVLKCFTSQGTLGNWLLVASNWFINWLNQSYQLLTNNCVFIYVMFGIINVYYVCISHKFKYDLL